MIKTVTITIQVDIKSKQCEEWVKPSDYFKCSVDGALDKIRVNPIKNYSDAIETDVEKASFTVKVQSVK